jgi:hypothetical protein
MISIPSRKVQSQITMKRFILLIILAPAFAILNPFQAYAQWYKKYGVANSNELTEAQCKEAMGNASEKVKVGVIIIVIGGAASGLGGILLSIPPTSHGNAIGDDFKASLDDLFLDIFGALFLITGGVIAATGTPIWITGAVRKSKIREALGKFPAKVSLSPRIIQDFNHYSAGLSLAMRF